MITFITDVFNYVILYLKVAAIVVFTVVATLFWRGNLLDTSTYVFVQEANKVLGAHKATSYAEYRYFYREVKSITKRYVDAAGNAPVSVTDNERYLKAISVLAGVYSKSDNNQLNMIIDGLKEVEFSQSSGSIILYQKLDSTVNMVVMYYYDLIYTMKNLSPFIFYVLLCATTVIPLGLIVEVILQLIDSYHEYDMYEEDNDDFEGEESEYV